MAPTSLTSRFLGTAFIAQFATSLAAGILSGPILAGGISEVLANISGNLAQMRASILLELLTSVFIIAMTSLLYAVLRNESRPVALVALGLWFAEAVTLAVSTLGAYALVTLSVGYAGTGAAASSQETLGVIFLGVFQHAGDIAMLFFGLGAFLWYYLLFKSRVVPRALSVWGLLSLPTVLVATLLFIWDRSFNPSVVLYAAYVPFELVIGLWLLIKGARPESLVELAESK
jgi:hypothetical protein